MKLKQIRVDGYKNLINCVVNLGDFNVLVGPNNSGKSNLLEAIQMVWPFCFGDDELREATFQGLTPPGRMGFSLCHLKKHMKKPMTIGITFEVDIRRKTWSVDYDVTVQCTSEENGKGGFVREKLAATSSGKTGPRKTYLLREGKSLKVALKGQNKKKLHRIAKDTPALQAVRSLYAEFEGLPPEFETFFKLINSVSLTKIFVLSPKGLREAIDSEKPIEGIQVSSFDLSLVADKMEKKGQYWDLFKETLCDILELEDVYFSAKDVPTGPKKRETREKSKRMRLFAIKRIGDIYSLVDEYSDGTLAVAAILEALFSKDVRGPILCLEELENCLHPAAIEKLLRFLQDHSNKWPVLITTHSPYLLNGVRPEDVNVAVVDETGATHFEKVKDSGQLRNYLNKGLMSFGDLLARDFVGFRQG